MKCGSRRGVHEGCSDFRIGKRVNRQIGAILDAVLASRIFLENGRTLLDQRDAVKELNPSDAIRAPAPVISPAPFWAPGQAI